jgi:hypothetical protein
VVVAGGLAVAHLIIEYRQAKSLISSADATLDAPQTGQIQRDVSRMESSAHSCRVDARNPSNSKHDD